MGTACRQLDKNSTIAAWPTCPAALILALSRPASDQRKSCSGCGSGFHPFEIHDKPRPRLVGRECRCCISCGQRVSRRYTNSVGYVFDSALYIDSRESRLRTLFRHIDVHSLSAKRILEVGSGTGELGQAFVDAGCRVVSVDARPEYIEELKRRFPSREAYVTDVEHWAPEELGYFDVVLCFGLLYHVSTPETFLAACGRLAPELYLETVVTDSMEPVCPLVAEEGPDQAYAGKGCRPMPTWLRRVL